MNNLIKKITSRKFIIAVLVIASGLAAAFKNASNPKIQIVGYAVAGVAGIAYMLVEGGIDKADVKAAVADIASEALEGIELTKTESEETEK